jgi:phenylacetate-CoA ligase
MNPLGSMYINSKRHMSPIWSKKQPQSQQTELTEEFFEEWKNHQCIDNHKLLQESLHFAAESVPFYRRYFANNPDKNPGHLEDWPVLTRDHLWNDLEELKSNEFGRWKTWTHASGGSTGKPVAVVHDEYFAAKASALRKLCVKLFCNGPHYNQLVLWGMKDEVKTDKTNSLKARLKDELRTLMGIKTSHINTFEFSREKFEQCVHIMRHQKPEYVFGYAGSVYELAKYLDDNGISIPKSPKVVGTTAQTLHPFMREKIEQVFGCRVCDHYGSREMGPLAWQHESGPMYFPKFFSKIEVVDDNDNPVEPGQEGRLLLTSLHNFSMPIVRYDIGDRGVLGEDVTWEGYPFATLKAVSGRTSEEFINKNGSRVCGPFFINLFYYRDWLDQFYIVQRDYDHIELMYVAKPGYSSVPDHEREEIDKTIRTVMTEECRIDWTRVDEIPTTKAGKRLFIRSEVKSIAPKSSRPIKVAATGS